MAEGDGVAYTRYKKRTAAGDIDLDGDLLRVAFLTGYTPQRSVHDKWADISASECSGTGYTAGGATLATVAITGDEVNHRAEVDADNTTWTGLDLSGGGQPNYAVIYDDTHASDILIAYYEIATATNGGDYTLSWNADGWIWFA